ncbi:protein DOUBLE-STRAND BREAK FORMATION isoform X2 [Helianthus annuus]|uniref:protein DOUBLE-STRAND BREAK FORMATION isoform X2 n=1 Tax=Helianthus annuus TaxID=4232 RepID=UPI000B9051B0|nr:protein DOUBLE-STRAND BREAK FORMATION isoform X2 [Helianthus annuus]
MCISHQISLFCSLIQARRFDDGTLRILESILTTRDVKSLLDLQHSLKNFMRRESVTVLREINELHVDHKLLILEFFVCAFAITGDLESCLALRYEALVLREVNCGVDQRLHVSYSEWFAFAEHAVENRFYAIARKACEKALACFQTNDKLKTKDADTLSEHMEAIRKVKRLKDLATVRGSSQSGTNSRILENKNNPTRQSFHTCYKRKTTFSQLSVQEWN